MYTQTTMTPGNPRILLKLAIITVVSFLAMKIHAAITINFSSTPFGTNLQSDGSAVDSSFTFELGTFIDSFVPTAGNTDQWLANWTPVLDSSGSAVAEATAPYGTISSAFGDFDGFSSNVTLDNNNTPFEIGSQGYVWGFDSQANDSEWILLTNTDAGNEWIFGDTGAGSIPFSPIFSVSTAGEAIVGAINFTDGMGAPISFQTEAVSLPPAVPEPSTTIVLTATALAFALRRKRRDRSS